jgi:hypothetical protein
LQLDTVKLEQDTEILDEMILSDISAPPNVDQVPLENMSQDFDTTIPTLDDGEGLPDLLSQGTRKDRTLKEFLNMMDDYAPIVCIFAILHSSML